MPKLIKIKEIPFRADHPGTSLRRVEWYETDGVVTRVEYWYHANGTLAYIR